MNNGNMPANPVKGCDGRFIDCTDDNMQWLKQCAPSVGLSKREAFAMAAMQGSAAGDVNNELTVTDIVEQSVYMADALLKELAK